MAEQLIEKQKIDESQEMNQYNPQDFLLFLQDKNLRKIKIENILNIQNLKLNLDAGQEVALRNNSIIIIKKESTGLNGFYISHAGGNEVSLLSNGLTYYGTTKDGEQGTLVYTDREDNYKIKLKNNGKDSSWFYILMLTLKS